MPRNYKYLAADRWQLIDRMTDAAMTDEGRFKCKYYVLCTLTACNSMYSIRVAAAHTVLNLLRELQDNCWTNEFLHSLCLYLKHELKIAFGNLHHQVMVN